MTQQPELLTDRHEPGWVTRIGRTRPDIVLMAPFMAYLLLLGFGDQLTRPTEDLWGFVAAIRDPILRAIGVKAQDLIPVAALLRGAGSLLVFWLFRRYMPPMGRPYWGIAIIAGVLVAAMWVGGQLWFNTIHIGERSLGGRLFLFPGQPDADDPRIGISAFSWWAQVVMRISVATIAVPVVEELFWRAFLLRALINWDHFERVPLGTFTWFSFLGTSLLSTLEHPDNWGVSILCWFAYNGLMYWKRSILLLILTHGITNLVLYVYVVLQAPGRPILWLFW